MATIDPAIKALVEALDEPALVVERQVVRLANSRARELIGQGIEGSDIRFAIRHPQALDFVLAGRPGEIDFTGVGAFRRPWRLSLRRIESSSFLLRLIDRSAAQSAEKMRVDFVADASHELRTPLAAILGYAESLEDPDLEPAMATKFAATIRTEAKRMLRIIEDLMSLSRIQADRFVAPLQNVSVGAVVESAVEGVRNAALKRHCAIDVDVEPGLPEIAGDFPQLVQVFDNLLNNALRYGCVDPDSGISIVARLEGQAIRLDVADKGPGIAREHLPFLTRRFYRVDEARSREGGGTGLGLAIVKHIVERHRGSLEIESTPGLGTNVSVRLPVR